MWVKEIEMWCSVAVGSVTLESWLEEALFLVRHVKDRDVAGVRD